MPDEVQTEQVTVEETQPGAMLSPDQTEVQEDEIGNLPEDASERTKEQFEKLKQRNKELAEKLRQQEQVQPPSAPLPNVFESFRLPNLPLDPPPAPPVQTKHLTTNQVKDIYSKLVDDNGFIDQELLKQALSQAEERAARAEMEAKRTRAEFQAVQENEQVRQAHKAFPALDPKSKHFNRGFYNAVKNEMVSQMLNGQKDLVEAAEKVASWFPLPKEQPKTETTEKKTQQVRQIQAAAPASGSVKTTASQEDLVRRTQQGDRSALMERLRRAGY